jgi:hypothetical protein
MILVSGYWGKKVGLALIWRRKTAAIEMRIPAAMASTG